jgi:hypothetical protein
MLMVELTTNQAELRRLRDIGLWGGAPGGPRRNAWDAYGVDIVRVADAVLMDTLVRVYSRLDGTARLIALAEEPDGGPGFEDVFTGEHGASIDIDIELLDEALLRLWVFCQPKHRIWITKGLRWLRSRHLLPTWADPVKRAAPLAERHAR